MNESFNNFQAKHLPKPKALANSWLVSGKADFVRLISLWKNQFDSNSQLKCRKCDNFLSVNFAQNATEIHANDLQCNQYFQQIP